MLEALVQLTDTVPAHLRRRRIQRGPAASSRADMHFTNLGNALVRYRQAGQGPSLVLATDPPVPLELYDELIELLAPRFRVTVLELPGFGGSLPRAGFRYSMRTAVAGMARFLEVIGGAPHILGLPCVAGFVSIGLARERPELVEKLILMQTPDWKAAQHWRDGRDPSRILRKPVLGQLALSLVRRKRVRGWYQASLASPGLIEPFSAATLELFDNGGCFCLASAFQDFLSNQQGVLGPVDKEALLIWGDADSSHKTTDPASALKLVPRAQLVRFPQAGHFPELECSGEFAELVIQSVT